MSYNVKAVLSAEDRGYTAAMRAAAAVAEDVEERTEKATSQAKAFAIGGVAARAVAAAFGAVKSAVGSAISRLDTLNNYPKVMQSLGFSAEQAASSQDKLVAGIEGLPTTLDGIVGNTQQLVSSLGDLDKATDTAIALNNMFLAGGQGADAASRAFTQYNQMLAKGKVDMQSWMSIVQTAPAQVQQLAQTLLGATANQTDLYNALQSGELALTDLNNAVITLNNEGGANFTSFAQQAMDATGGIATGLSNIRSAVIKGVANTINAIDQALQAADLPGISTQLGMVKSAINTVFSAIQKVVAHLISVLAPVIKSISSTIKQVITTLRNVLAPVIGFVSKHFDAFQAAIKGVVGGLVAMKIAKTVQSHIDKMRDASKKAAQRVDDFKRANEKLGGSMKELIKKSDAQKKAEDARAIATKKAAEADEAAKKAIEARQATELKEGELARLKSDKATSVKELEAAEQEYGALFEQQRQAEVAAERAATEATEAHEHAIEQESAAQTMANTQISMKDLLLGVLSGKISLATAAQYAWNTAMNANPIGLVITAISALISVVGFLGKLFDTQTEEEKKAAEAHKEMVERTKEAAGALAGLRMEMDNTEAALSSNEAEVENLLDTITQLSRVEKKSEEQKHELAVAIAMLNDRVEGLDAVYDEATDTIEGGTDALIANAKAAVKSGRSSKYIEQQSDALDELNQLNADAQKWTDRLTESEELFQQAQKKLADSTGLYNTGLASLTEEEKNALSAHYEAENALNELAPTLEAAAETYEEISEKVAASKAEEAEAVAAANQAILEAEQKAAEERAAMEAKAATEQRQRIEGRIALMINKQKEALDTAIANETASLDQLTEANQETIGSLQEAWQGYVDHATDMFDTLSEKSELSAQQMIDNMKKNQEVIENWGNNMQTLRDRFAALGLDDAVLDQLQSMGPEAAGAVAQFVTATDDQLGELSTTFSGAGAKATQAMYNSMSEEAAANAKTVEYLVTPMQTSLDTAVANANWADIGDYIPEGVEEGVIRSTPHAVEAARSMADQMDEEFESRQEISSPSGVFEDYGGYITQGLAQGILSTMARVLTAIRSIADRMNNVMKPMASRMRSIGISAGQGFAQGLAATAGAVQATAANIANTAAATIQNALQIHSPSRVLERLGEYTGQGFIDGISAMEQALTRTVDHFAETASGISVSSWDAGPNRGYTLAGANGINLAGGGVHYSVTVPLVIDGHEFAVAVVDDITDQQDRNSRHDARKNGVK